MSGPIVASTNVVAIAVVIAAAAATTAGTAGTDAGACAGAACRATRVMLLEVVKMLVVVVAVGGYLFERIWGSAVVAKMILEDALLLVDLIYRSSSMSFKWWT